MTVDDQRVARAVRRSFVNELRPDVLEPLVLVDARRPDLDERANSPWARFSSAELPERATETFGVHGGLERLGAISQAVGPDASNSPFEVHINWYRRAQGASTKSR